MIQSGRACGLCLTDEVPQLESCYLCGQPGRTRDHIPPKGFFPKPYPDNLVTVACCHGCNKSWEKEDEAMQAILSIPIGRSESGEIIWEKCANKGPIAKSEGFRKTLLARMEEVPIHFGNWIFTMPAIRPPWERINPWMVRIVKGLLRHHYPTFDYTGSSFEVRCIPPTEEELLPVVQRLKFFEKGSTTFFYRYCLTDSENGGLWYLVFYECIGFLIVHSDEPFR